MLYSLIARFRKDPIQGTILLGILLSHFIFLIMILFSSPDSFRKKEHKHLVVRTIVPQPQSKIAAAQKTASRPSPAPIAQSAPQKKTPETPKPEIKKQEVAKVAAAPVPVKKQSTPPTPAPKKEPAIADKKLSTAKQAAPQKATPPAPRAKISDALLKELEESIAKIENKSDKTTLSKKASAPITLQIDINIEGDTGSTSDQNNYTDTLINHLHQSLQLPDYGEVKIQLSLRQDGTVAKVIVLKAKNEKNRLYLESNLLRLRFPRFDGALANKKEHTFVLTFCNEK